MAINQSSLPSNLSSFFLYVRSEIRRMIDNPPIPKPLFLAIAIAVVSLSVIAYLLFATDIESIVAAVENKYLLWFNQNMAKQTWWYLPIIGYFGGLIASVSPCIIGLLPLNLGYIGTLEVDSRRRAMTLAGGFVLGVILVISLMGLVSSFAASLLIDYKGYMNLGVGLLAMLMGLSFFGLLKLPMPQLVNRIPQACSTFVVGIAFALSSSPCASPVLISILAIAATTGNPWVSTLTMASYALGYTTILFIASVATGITKQVGKLRYYSSEITYLGSISLVILGAYYLVLGVRWFLS
jgi:cytochrome c-type biogenesis protein